MSYQSCCNALSARFPSIENGFHHVPFLLFPVHRKKRCHATFLYLKMQERPAQEVLFSVPNHYIYELSY